MRHFALVVLLAALLGFFGCKRTSNLCFDNPDEYAADLKRQADASLRLGGSDDAVRQFCTTRHLIITQRGTEMYCTAEAHRVLSRCNASLVFEFSPDGSLKRISVTKPEIKNP